MFYLISSKLPLISTERNSSTKLFRSFFVGSICYIILHGYLFSQKFKDNNLVQKYKKYIYYLWGADLLMTSIIIKFLTKSQPEVKKQINVEDDDDESEMPNIPMQRVVENNLPHNAGKIPHPQLSRQQIMEEFYRNQKIPSIPLNPQIIEQKQEVKQEQKTPFIPKHEKITEESDDDMSTASSKSNQEKIVVSKKLKEISEKSSESDKKAKKTKSKKESESSSESVKQVNKSKKQSKKDKSKKEETESESETESDIEVQEYKSKK